MKRSPAEIKADDSRHYGEMAGRMPAKEVKESFERPAYKIKGNAQNNQKNSRRK